MIGLQVLARQRRVDTTYVEAFRGVPVANISDCMSRMTAGGSRLRPMHRGGSMSGPALTVKTRPGDNLMIHKAISMADRGDVIVVDAGGDLTNSLFGEIMLAQAAARGVAGMVLHGAVRDSEEIGRNDLPVYAAGISHRGPYKDGPGEINVPIAIDGMVIEPGDLIVGDADGMLCIPFAACEQVLEAVRAKMEAERKTLAEIAAGTFDASWIDATLKRIGCNTRPA